MYSLIKEPIYLVGACRPHVGPSVGYELAAMLVGAHAPNTVYEYMAASPAASNDQLATSSGAYHCLAVCCKFLIPARQLRHKLRRAAGKGLFLHSKQQQQCSVHQQCD